MIKTEVQSPDFLSLTNQASNFTSEAKEIHGETVGVSVVWSEAVATLAGTVKLQGAVRHHDDWWVDIPNSETAMAGSGSQHWDVSPLAATFIRVVGTITTGQINIDGVLVEKDSK